MINIADLNYLSQLVKKNEAVKWRQKRIVQKENSSGFSKTGRSVFILVQRIFGIFVHNLLKMHYVNVLQFKMRFTVTVEKR